MSRASRFMTGVAALLSVGMTGACVDEEAGAILYSGRPALMVGLDRPGALPTATVRGRLGSSTRPDSLRMVLSGLPGLASQQYQVWLVEADESGVASTTRVPVTHLAERLDTVGIDPFTEEPITEWVAVGERGQKQGFTGAAGQRHIVDIGGTAVPVDFSEKTHVVVTIGDGDANPTTAPTTLWYRFREPDGSLDASGNAVFGFDPNRPAAADGFQVAGSGRVEFLNTVGFGLLLESAIRPLPGFYYAVWLYDEDTGETLRLGDLATPFPEYASLRNADVERNEFVTAGRILQAGFWREWAEIGRGWDEFTHVRITLEAKAGDPDQMSPITIYQAAIPAGLDRLPSEREGIDQLF